MMQDKCYTLKELYESDCKEVPKDNGIYRVLVPDGMKIVFRSIAINVHAPLYPAEVLQEKFSKCKNKTVLYIGKASGRKGLRQRLKQYMKYGWNEAVNHKGGRAIWQIEGADQLLLQFECCEDADEVEHRLLREYQQENGSYPLANWRG